jgi:hypothetical protein
MTLNLILHSYSLCFHIVKRFLYGECNIIHNIYEDEVVLCGIGKLKVKRMFHTQILNYVGVNKKETRWLGLLGEDSKVKRNEKRDYIQHKSLSSLLLGFLITGEKMQKYL